MTEGFLGSLEALWVFGLKIWSRQVWEKWGRIFSMGVVVFWAWLVLSEDNGATTEFIA
jgi:hypothetical protein